MTAVAGRPPTHAPRVIVLTVLLVLLAFLAQTALLPAVGLSATVPVVFAAVVLVGVALGVRTGAVCGFLAGLLLDLTGLGTLGVGALLGCLLGAAAGRIRVDRWWFSGVPTAALLTIGAAVALGAIDAALVGRPPAPPSSWWWIVLGGALSVAVLVPLRTRVRAVVR